MLGKILAVILILAALIAILREYVVIPLAIVLLLFLIRFIADIFWKGKDEGWW